ncbi:hypothetical protein P7K49_034188 [Saguinus oedipus]|uniref:Ubiquitin-like domain-containing protein n=1 Tax=Saguinus oedipus TaxID=9490 RepID=A0ABQ9TUI6_SAGOE|nr:hypothetical protein P7K49_034188 [Saguinus oedipus]
MREFTLRGRSELLPVLPPGFSLRPPFWLFPGRYWKNRELWETSRDWLGPAQECGEGRRRLADAPGRGARIGRGPEQGAGLLAQQRRRLRLRSGCEAAGPLRSQAGRGKMEVTGVSAPTVTLFISSSLNTFRSEKRYSRSLTIAEFKCKLELLVGSPASCMELELYGVDDKFYSKLDQEDALLGSYPVDDGCRIHSELELNLEVQPEPWFNPWPWPRVGTA